ncbi:hypothetical protein [Stieleria marina]|uniref:glycosyl-4,4'-diaponeurosporenoate acyltransferase CrtO family protein n=1 Tax=Stieleria marina TaxID=1930275 RepID=UPI003AF34A31
MPFVRWVILRGRLNCNPGLKRVKNGQIETLVETRKALTIAEFGHWIGFVVMLAAIGASIVAGVPSSVLASHFVVNVLGNAYLSLVQQYNRRRVDRLIARAERRGIDG